MVSRTLQIAVSATHPKTNANVYISILTVILMYTNFDYSFNSPF
jgi:hypothetical protein